MDQFFRAKALPIAFGVGGGFIAGIFFDGWFTILIAIVVCYAAANYIKDRFGKS